MQRSNVSTPHECASAPTAKRLLCELRPLPKLRSPHPIVADPRSADWADHILRLSSRASGMLPESQAAEVVSLGRVFVERTRGLCSAWMTGGEAKLLAAARRNAETAQALRWLRLMASAHIRTHTEDFDPYAIVCFLRIEPNGILCLLRLFSAWLWSHRFC